MKVMRLVNMSLPEAKMPQPERIILESEVGTVRLMQLIPEDDQAYASLIAYDPDHLRQNGDTTADKYPDAAAVRQSIEQPTNPDKYRFGIWDGDAMVGSDNLTPEGNGKAELGSWIGKQYVGQGYAGRARSLLVDFAFNQLGLDEVHCDITVGNEPSRRSVEKSGFQFDGEFTDENGKQQWRFVLKRQEGSSDKRKSFTLEGQDLAVSYQETQIVKEGVECDIYTFSADDSKDLAIVRVAQGYKTPLQRILKGTQTTEGYVAGTGTLTIRSVDGQQAVYNFGPDADNLPVAVEVGQIMQWYAESDLTFSEVCEPPYEDGRFEDLKEDA